MIHITPWHSTLHGFHELEGAEEPVSWLLESGSITARLRRRWPALVVELLDEGVEIPSSDERERLALGSESSCWVREVQLHSHGEKLVHARTVIPDWGDNNPWKQVATLGRQPLGDLLFSLPGLRREPLEFALTQMPLAPGQVCAPAVPSRRRIFVHQGAPLLLTEAFDFLSASWMHTKETLAQTD